MNKLFFSLILLGHLAFAAVIKPNTSDLVKQDKIDLSNELGARYGDISGNDIIDNIDIPEQVRDLDIDENLVNNNIKISLTNKTDLLLAINGIGYVADGKVCGFTKLKIELPSKVTKADYFVEKKEGLKCLSLIEKKNEKYGNLTLIDISSRFDIKKYQQFSAGLFLFPINLKVLYSNKGAVAIRTKRMYLIYSVI